MVLDQGFEEQLLVIPGLAGAGGKSNEIRFILIDDIVFFQADTKYTTVATLDGDFDRANVPEAIDEPARSRDVRSDSPLDHRQREVRSGRRRALDGTVVLGLKGRPELLSVSEANRHLFKMM